MPFGSDYFLFPRIKGFGVKHPGSRWQIDKRYKNKCVLCRTGILLAQDVMALKGLKGLKLTEYINGIKLPRGCWTPRCHLWCRHSLSCSHRRLVTLLGECHYVLIFLPKQVIAVAARDRILDLESDPAYLFLWSSINFQQEKNRGHILVLRTFKHWILQVQFPELSRKNLNLTDIKSIQWILSDLGFMNTWTILLIKPEQWYVRRV